MMIMIMTMIISLQTPAAPAPPAASEAVEGEERDAAHMVSGCLICQYSTGITMLMKMLCIMGMTV